MKNKTNLELLELYNGELRELAKVELEKRVYKYARAKTGNIHLILGFIPKTSKEDEVLVKRFDGIYKITDSANIGLIISRDNNGKIIWIKD